MAQFKNLSNSCFKEDIVKRQGFPDEKIWKKFTQALKSIILQWFTGKIKHKEAYWNKTLDKNTLTAEKISKSYNTNIS